MTQTFKYPRRYQIAVEIGKIHKIAAVTVVLLVISGFLAYYTFGRSETPTVYLVGFDCDEAYVDMQYLTDIGPRVPGTSKALEGARYVETRFNEAGLSGVHIEEHSITTFEVNSAFLSLVVYGLRNGGTTNYVHVRDFVLYQYSGSTNGEVTYDIVDVGDGSEEALSSVDVRGKAVITTQQALPRAAEHGARAVIVQNLRSGRDMGYPPYSGGLYGGDENGDSIPYPDANPGAVIPTCSVSKAVGDEIKEAVASARTIPILGRSTVQVRMNFDTTIAKNNIYNVVGDVPGEDWKGPGGDDTGNGDEGEGSDGSGGGSDSGSGGIVYIVAHRDTTYINSGAVDNTVGTVTIMEMARQLADYDVRRTIRFISVDAEEKGLLGATEYVKSHEDEVKERGIICINFDMNDVNLDRVDTLETSISNAEYRARLEVFRDRLFDSDPDLADKYNINISDGGGGPDAAPFMKREIDGAFAMGEWGSSWEYHTQYDTIKHVNRESWQLGGIIFGTLAVEIAGLR